MPFIVTHEDWGVLVQEEPPAQWLPWRQPDAVQRARRFRWKTDAVRATRAWEPSVRARFRIVEVDG